MELPTKPSRRLKSFGQTTTLLYSEPKVGKSTWASKIPNALFLATEDGLSYLEVASIPITTWSDFYKAGKLLKETKHEYKTIVVDIVDYAYQMCEDYICLKNRAKFITDIPNSGGYGQVKREFISVFNKINNELGIGVVFISHAKVRELKKQETKVTTMGPSLTPSVSELICGFCDHIFYAYIDEKGKSIMRTKPTKYINAGDRSGMLPDLLPFDYSSFETEYEKVLKAHQ